LAHPESVSSKLAAVSRDAAAAIGAATPEILRAENPTELPAEMPTNVATIWRVALPGPSLFELFKGK
jgi:hypothetical protein